jgi:hypothetical protein
LNRFAKSTTGRELASSETVIPTKETSNMGSCTVKVSSAGLMELSIEVNSEAMKSLEMDVTNGQMDLHTRAKSKMASDTAKENTSTQKKV